MSFVVGEGIEIGFETVKKIGNCFLYPKTDSCFQKLFYKKFSAEKI